jgi:hypothetical protein
MRFIANQVPLVKPYFFNDCSAYCEQVGVNLHLGPIKGEMPYWYILINARKGKLSMRCIIFIELI